MSVYKFLCELKVFPIRVNTKDWVADDVISSCWISNLILE